MADEGQVVGFGWRNRNVEAAPEDAEESVLDAAGSERLRALARRAIEGENDRPAALPVGGPAITTLAANPFAELELDIAADAGAINEAFDRLSFEPGRDEAALTAARAALMAPRERLAAELRWVTGLPRPTMDALRVALRSRDVETLAAIHARATGAGRFNLAFALFECDSSDVQAGLGAIMDAREVDPDALLDALDEARFAAREREIDRALFDECLADWARHAGASVALSFAGQASGRMALARGLQVHARPNGRFDAGFREALLGAYAGEVARALDQSQGRIEDAIKTLRAEPDNAMGATSLLTALDIWSGLRRPIQVHEAARGLDDPASGEIFAAVRSLAIELSNDHDQYEIALRLGRALLSSFALVPIHRAALEREFPTLIGNAAVKRAGQLHEMAIADLKGFARQVKAGGLDRSGGLAGSIATLVEDVADLKDGNALEAVFGCLRDIAIQLNNVGHDREAAYAMIAWLSAHGPPAAVAQRLEEDLRHFGIHADIAVRDAVRAESPAPPQSRSQAEAEPRSPAGFGRARPSGQVTAPAVHGSTGKPAPPPRHTPAPDQPVPPRLPPSAGGDEKKPFKMLQAIVIVVVLSAFIFARHERKMERLREARGESEEVQPAPPTQAERDALARRNSDHLDQIMDKLRRERAASSSYAPAPAATPPAVEVEAEQRGPSASGATIEVRQP